MGKKGVGTTQGLVCPCHIHSAGVPWSVQVQWVHWGAGNGNGLKVPTNTSTGTKSSVHANPAVTCLQDGLGGSMRKHPNALSSSRFGRHDAAGQGAEDTGQGVQPCCCGECCCALSFACWRVPWQGALGSLRIPWEGGPHSQLSRSPLLPDVALLRRSPWVSCSSERSKNRADLLHAFVAVPSQRGVHLIEQSRVKFQADRKVGCVFDVTPFF